MRKTEPTPRREAYDLYWYFAAKRHEVFERRVKGQPAPWTDDEILGQHKFTNVYRAADRVSQFMIRDVCYNPEKDAPADRLFQIVAFRTFSKPSTWRLLQRKLGHTPRIEDLRNGNMQRVLDAARASGTGLYTGAFILCASDAYGHRVKHRNHVALFHDMFVRHSLADDLLKAKSLEEVYNLLHGYPLMGDFMSYQTAIDLNYSQHINFSENDFTQPGPGAMRGIQKCFTDLGDYSPREIVHWMVDRQQQEFERLELPFAGLWGRKLHAIDCQGLFCEVDKYARVALPHLTSNRTRIKAKFTATKEPLALFFPPKWKLNTKLPKGPVLGQRTLGLA